MATILTNIEGILSDIEFIVTLEANEIRLVSAVTQLSDVEVPSIFTTYDLPPASGTALAEVSGVIRVEQSLEGASANALGDGAAILSPINLLRTDLNQLSDVAVLMEGRRELASEGVALSSVFSHLGYGVFLQTEAVAEPYAEAVLSLGVPLNVTATALATALSELDTNKKISCEMEALSDVSAILSDEISLNGVAGQLSGVVGTKMTVGIPLVSEAKCLTSSFGHFGYGEFLATTLTQLSYIYGNVKEGFALKASGNALSEISVDLEIRKHFVATALQLTSVSAFIDILPYLNASADCLASSSVAGITTVAKIVSQLNQLTSSTGSLRGLAAVKSTQVTQLTDTDSSLILAFTFDGYADALTYVEAFITPKLAFKSNPTALCGAKADHLAILSKIISDDVTAFATTENTVLSVRIPMKTETTALSGAFGFSTCIKFMRKTQITQLTDAVSKITTTTTLSKECISLPYVYGDLQISSKLLSEAVQLATSSPVLTERIELLGDLTSLATVVGSSVKPTKRLPAVNLFQLSEVFGDIQNNWTGVYARLTTQLSEASVVKIATKVVFNSEGTSLSTVYGTEVTPNITLDTDLTQLSSLFGYMGKYRDLSDDAVQLSDVSGIASLFKTLSVDSSQLSDSQAAVTITSKKLFAEAAQVADAVSAVSCTKRLSAGANALGFVYAHIYHDVTIAAEVGQLAFVSARLLGQMKASATQLAVTHGRIRGSTFGRVSKPTLELYTG